MTRSPLVPAPRQRAIWSAFAVVLALVALVAALVSTTGLPDGEVSIESTEPSDPLRTEDVAGIAARASFTIDAGLANERPMIPGLDGDTDRGVGAAMAPDGSIETFVADEVILHDIGTDALRAFLERYDGEVLRTSGALTETGERDPAEDELADWYLVRVDPFRADIDGLGARLATMGPKGEWTFSSESAARLVALASGESDLEIDLNAIADVATCEVCEHPTISGDNLDAASSWWMEQDLGLGIGVVHAWEYLRYQGFPPLTPYEPVLIAIVDGGFDLDETTGEALYGAADFAAARPRQLDEVDGDLTAGGAGGGFLNCDANCWHGQMTFGIAAANGDNGYGIAGTSGGATTGARVDTLLVRIAPDVWTIAAGIHDALFNGADVIVPNVDFDCGWTCRWFNDGFDADGNYLKATVQSAPAYGATVVAPAGNAHPGKAADDITDNEKYPCSLIGVVCVAAIERNGAVFAQSNWGEPVDIWAPTGIATMISRSNLSSFGNLTGPQDLPLAWGTSASAPYVAGIVALMKALDPGVVDAETVLAATANPLVDPKVATGYVDAFDALEAIAPNQPPVVTIAQPRNGDSVGRHELVLHADVDDPEKHGPWGDEFENTVDFVSDRDGLLCTTTGIYRDVSCLAPALSLGEHRIRVTGTDAFGATGSATVTVDIADNPPTATITAPADGSRHAPTGVDLTGYGFDPDEEIPASSLAWTSSIDGSLGTGRAIRALLSPGGHTITLTVTDSAGVTASTSIDLEVVVGDGYPTVRITTPPDMTLVAPGTPLVFEGTATDPEDGQLTGRSLTWSSDIDGEVGTGGQIEVVLSGDACDSTLHEITLEGTDADGHVVRATVFVNVVGVC